MAGYSDPINHAFAFAAKHHDQQVRKGTRYPYLTAAPNLAVILARYAQDDATLVAGITGTESLCEMRAVGLNERFRCYRYEPGQRFAPHRDGYFERNDRERSLLTFMIYLNDDFSGGETAFLSYGCSAKPRVGTALLFQHLLDHEGCVVRSGVKYVLRSDVMYRS